jgi:hypothetical protein
LLRRRRCAPVRSAGHPLRAAPFGPSLPLRRAAPLSASWTPCWLFSSALFCLWHAGCPPPARREHVGRQTFSKGAFTHAVHGPTSPRRRSIIQRAHPSTHRRATPAAPVIDNIKTKQIKKKATPASLWTAHCRFGDCLQVLPRLPSWSRCGSAPHHAHIAPPFLADH